MHSFSASSDEGVCGELSHLRYSCDAVTPSQGKVPVVSVMSEVHMHCGLHLLAGAAEVSAHILGISVVVSQLSQLSAMCRQVRSDLKFRRSDATAPPVTGCVMSSHV